MTGTAVPAACLLAISLALAALCPSSTAAAEPRSVFDDPWFVPTLMSGLDAVYDLDLERGEAIFAGIAHRYPDHPVVPLLRAQTIWWRLLVDPTVRSRDELFAAALEETIGRSDRRLEADPDDIDAPFFRATALAYRGRLHSLRHEWIQAAWDGKRALALVRELHRRRPDDEDLYFGLGLYDYFAEVVPERHPILKTLSPFFPRGDRTRGLARIRRAAHHGTFSRTEATYFLFLIAYHFERDPAEAERLIGTLRGRYPHNPLFHVYEGRVRFRWRSPERARRLFADVLARYERGGPGYTAAQGEIALYYLARCAMAQGRYNDALSRLDRLETLAERRGSEFLTLAFLRRGMTYDALGIRPAAVAAYRRALELPDSGVAHEKARRYLRTPFVG